MFLDVRDFGWKGIQGPGDLRQGNMTACTFVSELLVFGRSRVDDLCPGQGAVNFAGESSLEASEDVFLRLSYTQSAVDAWVISHSHQRDAVHGFVASTANNRFPRFHLIRPLISCLVSDSRREVEYR